MIFHRPAAALEGAYPATPAALSHGLAGDRLFDLSALIDLARRLPADRIEYNSGDLPIEQDPSKTPMNGLSIEETLRRIEECRSWMAIKNAELDEAYQKLMARCLAEIEPAVRPATGGMHQCHAYIFISSPGAVTPFHMDPEHNILLQLRGSKTMHVYADSVANRIPQETQEDFHAGVGHRNLAYSDDLEAEARAYELSPGDALYVPVKAPHRVTNGDDVSVSFSITWRSNMSAREARLHLANRKLRGLGIKPRPPRAAPLADEAKIFAHKVLTRLGGKY